MLWKPSPERVSDANLTRFIRFVNDKYGKSLEGYPELYDWSISDLEAFHGAIWEFFEVIHSQPYDQVVAHPDQMPGAKWYPGARLNFAENLLRYRDNHTAIIFCAENGFQHALTYAELYAQTASMAAALGDMGVTVGDRVVGFMPNIPETIVAMLAATSLGATWSSCSPDFGFRGVMDRFGQVRPKVLFTADGYFYNGKTFDSLAQVADDKDRA